MGPLCYDFSDADAYLNSAGESIIYKCVRVVCVMGFVCIATLRSFAPGPKVRSLAICVARVGVCSATRWHPLCYAFSDANVYLNSVGES